VQVLVSYEKPTEKVGDSIDGMSALQVRSALQFKLFLQIVESVVVVVLAIDLSYLGDKFILQVLSCVCPRIVLGIYVFCIDLLLCNLSLLPSLKPFLC
jgi:hypothetical protein